MTRQERAASGCAAHLTLQACGPGPAAHAASLPLLSLCTCAHADLTGYDPDRSSPPLDVVPTFKTNNSRMLMILDQQRLGLLRITDAERLQVCSWA